MDIAWVIYVAVKWVFSVLHIQMQNVSSVY